MTYNPKDPQSLEKYSSAVTLSDMEVFIFPELLYALVLANILSPVLWSWRSDPWFENIEKQNEYRRVLRIKQFIMDRFAFNLDLDTWGLTTKEKELSRFAGYIDESVLAQSNALFGYEGDTYYFDIDIRRHFGLDKYTTNVIPYWKTETLEAMEAFRYKPDYPTGAGECVSLSTLYAAALFVLGGISLDKIHLMATPLHSQNFIDVRDGLLTNNRRIVTKNMWFNGTELSSKARRALENEKVTVVVNNTGYIHTMYHKATINPGSYSLFAQKLGTFLRSNKITFETLASFLRQNSSLQKCFQIAHSCCGKPRYIEIEKVFHYEHSSKYRFGDTTGTNLLHEIDEDEFYPAPIGDRIIINELESFFRENDLPADSAVALEKLKSSLRHSCYVVENLISDLIKYCKTEPRLPPADKQWEVQEPIRLDGMKTREEIAAYLESVRSRHPVADLAFMTSRDMNRAPWKPFLKAAFERNPVCILGSRDMALDTIADTLNTMTAESIYDGSRVAQPDEVWNYRRGDGLEKALCLMNIVKNRMPHERVSLKGDGRQLAVSVQGGKEFFFETKKDVRLPEEDDYFF